VAARAGTIAPRPHAAANTRRHRSGALPSRRSTRSSCRCGSCPVPSVSSYPAVRRGRFPG